MRFKAFWMKLAHKNKSLADDDATMRLKVSEFKRHLERAYDEGHKDGKAFAAQVQKLVSGQLGAINDIFGK